jgi:NAD(P)-dependent dehydrogenase (short-subunit alcohol dehydrogenase family)
MLFDVYSHDAVAGAFTGRSRVLMLLNGRVAVVTGGGRGIGREIALCLAREGADVVVDDVGSSLDGRDSEGDPAAAVAREIRESGRKAVSTNESVSDFEGARRIVDAAKAEFGRLDIVVNNAGNLRNSPLSEMSEEDFDSVIAVHLKGTFNVGHHAAGVMKRQGYGRIINMTSGGGLRGNTGHTNYGAAKAGVMGMTFVWALELAGHGITVNALAPQGETRMTERMFEQRGVRGRPALHASHNAALVAYLASERSGHVSGQVFGRAGFGYTIFQTPRPVAMMWRGGGWTPEQVANHFDEVLGMHLQPVGIGGVRLDKRGG